MPKDSPPSVGRNADLAARFPRASAAFLRLNSCQRSAAPMQPNCVSLSDPTPAPKPKRSPRTRPLAARQVEKKHPGFYLVRVKSFRVRPLDTDNLVPKWHVDALRYAGILPSDAPDRAQITTSQEKVGSKADERTEIIISIEPLAPAINAFPS